MRSRSTGFILLALLLVYPGWHVVHAQSSHALKQNSDLATKQFGSVVLEGQMFELFSKLALEHDIPIGLETGFEAQDLNVYRLELTNGTLAQLLDQFVNQNPNYAWVVENGVVNVVPNRECRDPLIGKVLSIRVKELSVEKGTGALALQNLLFTSPAIKATLDQNGVEPAATNFTGFYFPQLGREFSLKVSNRTTKEILNQIIRESPVARFWTVSRDISAGTMRLTVGSRPEPVAPKD